MLYIPQPSYINNFHNGQDRLGGLEVYSFKSLSDFCLKIEHFITWNIWKRVGTSELLWCSIPFTAFRKIKFNKSETPGVGHSQTCDLWMRGFGKLLNL